MTADRVSSPEAGLVAVTARLVAEFPAVAPEVIDRLLEASLGRTDGARVQRYRLVLAERTVRSTLKRGRLSPGGPLQDDPDPIG